MRSRMQCCRLGLLLIVAASYAAASGKGKAEEQARPLLKAAEERSLFHADKSAPFGVVFKFNLRIPKASGGYSWLVTPDGDWRKETQFLNYTDLEINRGTTLWTKRSTAFRPLSAGWVEGAFNNFEYLNRAEDKITRYFTTSDHHVELRCMDVLRNETAQTLCFDPDDNLRRVVLKKPRLTYEYSDYRPAGKKFAPYKMIARSEEDGFAFEGTLDRLLLEPKFDASLLAPPSGASTRIGCLRPTLPNPKTENLAPNYPPDARAQRQQGSVTAYILIASDGSVQNPAIIQTGGQYLDAAVLETIRKWRFDPAMCGRAPVDFETEVNVQFTIETH